MPLYEYENSVHGITIDLRLPVDDRPDKIVLTRRRVPSGVTVGTGTPPPTLGDRLAVGYKTIEAAGHLRDHQAGYLDTATVKRALAMPDPADPADPAAAGGDMTR